MGRGEEEMKKYKEMPLIEYRLTEKQLQKAMDRVVKSRIYTKIHSDLTNGIIKKHCEEILSSELLGLRVYKHCKEILSKIYDEGFKDGFDKLQTKQVTPK